MHKQLIEVNKKVNINDLVELGWEECPHRFKDLSIYHKDEQRFLYDRRTKEVKQYYMTGKYKKED